MRSPGRPLRFLGYLVGGWVGLRAMSVLVPAMWTIATPSGSVDYATRRPVRDGGGVVSGAEQVTRPIVAAPLVVHQAPGAMAFGAGPVRSARNGGVPAGGGGWSGRTADLILGSTLGFIQPRMSGGLIDRLSLIVAGSDGRAEMTTSLPVAPSMQVSGRWSGSAWMLWRPDTSSSFVQAPLLGGSQAGARLDYRLTDGKMGQLSVYGRVSRAFVGPSSEEGAIGLAWRPGKLPVSFLAERRQRIGTGGRSGFALLAAGGIGPRDVVQRVEVEGYVQAGIVGLPGADGFADGKASVGYRLAPATPGRGSLTLGASVSGSVQPGAGRIDVGPELRFRLPVKGAGMRLSTEWRTRVVGEARPASGPAVTLVADF